MTRTRARIASIGHTWCDALGDEAAPTQHRLEATEKARGAAIKSLEQAAVRATSPSRRNPQS